MPVETTWTDERCTQLDDLWAAGFSAAIIADKLGGITRCAVIGKAHRRGLATRAAFKHKSGETKRKYIRRKLTLRDERTRFRKPMAEQRPVEIKDSEIPAAQRKTILTLGDHECRFPIGDGVHMFFCGGSVKHGS